MQVMLLRPELPEPTSWAGANPKMVTMSHCGQRCPKQPRSAKSSCSASARKIVLSDAVAKRLHFHAHVVCV